MPQSPLVYQEFTTDPAIYDRFNVLRELGNWGLSLLSRRRNIQMPDLYNGKLPWLIYQNLLYEFGKERVTDWLRKSDWTKTMKLQFGRLAGVLIRQYVDEQIAQIFGTKENLKAWLAEANELQDLYAPEALDILVDYLNTFGIDILKIETRKRWFNQATVQLAACIAYGKAETTHGQ